MNRYDEYWSWCDERDYEYDEWQSLGYFLIGIIPLAMIIAGVLYLMIG